MMSVKKYSSEEARLNLKESASCSSKVDASLGEEFSLVCGSYDLPDIRAVQR